MWLPVPVPVDTSGGFAPAGHAQVLSIYLPMLSQHWDVECEMRVKRPAPGSSGPGQGWNEAVETISVLKAHP